MKIRHIGLVTVLLAALVVASPVLAGAKLKINDNSYIDLGFRLQALYIQDDADINLDGSLNGVDDFKIRRARLRVKAVIGEHVEMFIQTEAGSGAGGSGIDMRIIDAFINFKVNPWAQIIAGLNMAPASRQNLTSSGALMAIDRPGIAYKSLTWGARALRSFSNRTYAGSAGNFSPPVAVRDTGVTLFGSGGVGDNLHLKYYLGVYDGDPRLGQDTFRTTARVQVNLWDAEAGYFNSSTYLAKKRTLGIGASYDAQSDVGRVTFDDDGDVSGILGADYTYYTVDAFLEMPLGDGLALTAEAAYQALDFDSITTSNPGVDPTVYQRSAGDGFYVQAGLYVNKWQPWVEYETWSSDDPSGLGNLDAYRVGITYFLEGQNANIKAGYENFSTDVPFGIADGADEDSASAVVVGLYVTY